MNLPSSVAAIAADEHMRPGSRGDRYSRWPRAASSESAHWQEEEESHKMSTLSLPVANNPASIRHEVDDYDE
jgi:hypothetical protein